MNFESLKETVLDLIQTYPYVAALIVAVCLLFMLRKPKSFFKFVLLLLVLAGLAYGISLFSGVVSVGGKGSNEMRNKTLEQIEKDDGSQNSEPSY